MNDPHRRVRASEQNPAYSPLRDSFPDPKEGSRKVISSELRHRPHCGGEIAKAISPPNHLQRALLFGLSFEICGEDGFGWCRRLQGIVETLEGDGSGFPRPVAELLAPEYGYRPGQGARNTQRVVEVLGVLTRRLQAQHSEGSPYLLGDALTALDIYSTAFVGLCKPLPADQCALPEFLRSTLGHLDSETAAALDPIVLEHRDRIYRDHLETPLTL